VLADLHLPFLCQDDRLPHAFVWRRNCFQIGVTKHVRGVHFMKRILGCLALAGVLLTGCGDNSAVKDRTESTTKTTPNRATEATASTENVVLSPANTKIQFVGKHTNEQPDRVGHFEKFDGKAEVDKAAGELKSVSVVIETGSLSTQFAKLTNHLNSPDFFDSRQFPTAKFESTRIEPNAAAGQDKSGGPSHTVTGNLTLLATTKEISFPAVVNVGEDGLTLRADFSVDRTEFGMDRLQEGVQKTVLLNVVVGEKPETQKGAGGTGGG
jgi:polyisoprenoid-binding protein YceI